MIRKLKPLHFRQTYRYKILEEEDPRREVIKQYILKHNDEEWPKGKVYDYMKRKLPEELPPNDIYLSEKPVDKFVAQLVKDKVIIQLANLRNRRKVQLRMNPNDVMIYNELEKIDKLISTHVDLIPKLNRVQGRANSYDASIFIHIT